MNDAPTPAMNGNPSTAKVAVLLGSNSDLPVMKKCIDKLAALEVPYDIVVASAHRTPERVANYVRRCEEAGVNVFICAAGGAAHLAGAVAAQTSLPVLGVPLAVPPLDGLDALLATVQMPPGVPVGTLAVGNFGATNAAILAAQIVGIGDPDVAARVRAARGSMLEGVLEKNRKLREELGLPPESAS